MKHKISLDQKGQTDNQINEQKENICLLGMFSRRINRKGFILGVLYALIPIGIAFLLEIPTLKANIRTDHLAATLNVIAVLLALVWIIFFIPTFISLTIRRLHDFNMSGGLAFTLLIPGINIILVLLLVIVPGNNTVNYYGPDINMYNFWYIIGYKKIKVNYTM